VPLGPSRRRHGRVRGPWPRHVLCASALVLLRTLEIYMDLGIRGTRWPRGVFGGGAGRRQRSGKKKTKSTTHRHTG
jgi:hypothetical protein